ncbi:rod-binding protein [Pseudotabrizicola alkalilacus]|uniref:Chemotaxis protein chel n=1 Tax=Pseudotabrizicola alkalilacus TaxID=2305252 RepID=A0A411YYF3_9RHOB|nr:rod-binding protein [Pseudotabrizicola alkalilacus]RGP35800.1 chemotaxis protein chel [Pseudotabrizicola alkalilacus]
MYLESALPTPLSKKHDHGQLYEKAKELEVAFLTEMLAHAGLGESPDAFGGGIGEEQFSSFLRTEQARGIVEKGGLGLAQSIFESLVKAQESKHDQKN